MSTMSSHSIRVRHRPAVVPRTARRGVPFVLALLVAIVLLGVAPAHAESPVAVGLRAGTTGVGADLTFRLSDQVHLRLAGGGYSYDTTIDSTDLDYDAAIDLQTALVLLDWYPRAEGFRISLGGGWNGTQADVTAPVEDLVRHLYPSLPAISLDFGTLTGTAESNDLVPALLVGWGNPFRGGPWQLSFEVGVLYLGKPQVDLAYRDGEDFQIDDIPGGRAFVDSLLAEQERELEKELEDYTILPVVSFTLSYRF